MEGRSRQLAGLSVRPLSKEFTLGVAFKLKVRLLKNARIGQAH